MRKNDCTMCGEIRKLNEHNLCKSCASWGVDYYNTKVELFDGAEFDDNFRCVIGNITSIGFERKDNEIFRLILDFGNLNKKVVLEANKEKS